MDEKNQITSQVPQAQGNTMADVAKAAVAAVAVGVGAGIGVYLGTKIASKIFDKEDAPAKK